MISRKAEKLVLARERLQALTPAELTEVSGGGDGHGKDEHKRSKRNRRHRHDKHHGY
jgi:hypothetical protein